MTTKQRVSPSTSVSVACCAERLGTCVRPPAPRARPCLSTQSSKAAQQANKRTDELPGAAGGGRPPSDYGRARNPVCLRFSLIWAVIAQNGA